MSAASHLFSLLEFCEEEGIEFPQRTRHITVDLDALAEIAGRLELPPYLADALFTGLSVKAAFALAKWAADIPREDRIRALRAWKRKRLRVAA